MKPLSPLNPALTLALGVATLTSCQWNIGECIRASGARQLGVDPRKPVDGKVYAARDSGLGHEDVPGFPRYAYMPEVTFGTEPDIVEFCGMGPLPRKVTDIRPTGRTVLVKDGASFASRKVDALPPGCVAYKAGERRWKDENDHRSFQYDPPQTVTRGSLGAQILAAPFDFCIDPVLSVATTPFFMLYVMGCGIFYPEALK